MAEVERTFSVATRGVGLPDYSIAKPVGQVPVGPVYTSSDVGELAARLGSPVTHDRRGNVLWFDDFEGLLNKWDTIAGAGGSVSLSTTECRMGTQSCKIVTGAAAGSQIRASVAYPSQSKLGFEIAFRAMSPHVIGFRSIVYTGQQQQKFYIQLDIDEGTLEFYQEGFIWTNFASGLPTDFSNCFYIAKLVIDPVTGKYTRFVLNYQEYDLSSYISVAQDNLEPPRLVCHYIADSPGFCATDYVDGAIITGNEPDNVT